MDKKQKINYDKLKHIALQLHCNINNLDDVIQTAILKAVENKKITMDYIKKAISYEITNAKRQQNKQLKAIKKYQQINAEEKQHKQTIKLLLSELE